MLSFAALVPAINLILIIGLAWDVRRLRQEFLAHIRDEHQ